MSAIKIPVIRITNPFNPREFTREELDWRPAKTLADYFPFPSAEVVVSINGKIIARDKFGVTYLDKTDNVVVCPVPTGGGGGGKQILAIVALIAVSVVTAGTGAAVAGAMMGTDAIGFAAAYGSLGVGIANAAVTMAGSLLVHSIFAPSKPTQTNGTQTSSYGVDGAKNTSVEGGVLPVNYGEFRTGGNVIAMHVDNASDDNQILYMLIAAGEGPVVSLTDIYLNDNPLKDYQVTNAGADANVPTIEVQTRLGLPSQTPIPWFNDTVVAKNQSHKLSTDWFYNTTSTEVDKLRLDFVAPAGLCTIDSKSGESKSLTVDVEMEFRVAGTSDEFRPMPVSASVAHWKKATGFFSPQGPLGRTIESVAGQAFAQADNGTVTQLDDPSIDWTYDEDGTPITDQDTLDYLADTSISRFVETATDGSTRTRHEGLFPVFSSSRAISSNKRSTVRASFATHRLPTNKYELRVRRVQPKSTDVTVMDELFLSDVNEITLDTLSYANTALVGLKIHLGDQLSGVPKVTFMNGGRMIQVYGRPGSFANEDQWFTAASKNPAWVVWDILTNRRFGGAMPASRLDFEAFKTWAAYCDEKGLQWNGPIDTEMNVWDACQLVLRVGHSQLVNVGTRYTVVTEKPDSPVMMFSVANMIEGSYKETWLGTQDRANEIDISFFDKTDLYRQRTIRVVDPAAITAGLKQRTSAITLFGVTDYETAYKEGQFQLNLNRYILKTISFSAPLEAIACSVGSLVYVQHDMTEWAVAGRFEAGSTESLIKLDRDVMMEDGKQYKLLAVQDAVQRATGSIYNVAGDSLFLNGFDGLQAVKRIQVGARDLRVAGIFNQGNGWGVIVDDATGIVAGDTYTLFDTDVIEEYDVVNVPGASSTITLQSPMTEAPRQFVNWMFGEVDKVKKPFRIKAITGSHEYQRDITALEYRPEVYDFSRYGSSVPFSPTPDTGIGPIGNLTVYEQTYISGSSVVSQVVASWSTPQVGMYAGADVFVQKNGGPMLKVDTAANRTSSIIDAAKGDTVVVKVVAYDIFGKRSQNDQAPSTSYKVVGEIPNIAVGGVTGVGFAWSGRDCKLNWRYNSTTHSYEFGSEPTGGDAGSLDPHFKDYEVRVYDGSHSVLRRTEYVTDNSYTYIYDKNFADGAARELVFEIRMRDTFNNLGVPAIVDAANLPPSISKTDVSATFESATISYQHSDDPDFAGAQIYVSEIETDLDDLTTPLGMSKLVYDGPDSSVVVPHLMFNKTYFYRVAPYDAFGKTGLIPSATLSFQTSYFNVDTIKDEQLQVNKFAKTIDPVGIVDVLPDPATWTRPQVVFLTTDSKIYRLSGGAWSSTVKAADIDGEILATQIADASINTAKFAQGIAPIGVVDALPAVAGYTGPQVLFLTTDSKLYRLSNGAWSAAVPATDVAGQLTDAQLAEISAAKVAGQLTDAQIAGIAAAKLTGTVTAAQIADAAINTAKFAQGIQPIAIVGALPAVNGYAGPSVVFLTTDGKVYRLTNGAWTAAVAATDMTGSITATQITDGAISTPKLAAGAITTAKLAAGAVTANEIAANAITAGNIAAGAITTTELAAGAITTAKLAAGAVTANEIAAGAVTTAKLTAGAITANELAASAVTAAKISAGAVSTAALAAGAVTADTIAASAITAAKISAGAVQAGALAAGAVTADSIAANAVTAGKVAAGAISTAQLSAGAVTANELAAGAVSADKIAANSVTTAKLAAGAVTANEIAANAITSGKIAAGAVTADQIAANTITASQLSTGQLLTASAQIGDGLIVNAKIGNAEVDTLKIGNNAVTVPSAVYTAGSVDCPCTDITNGNDVVIQTLTTTATGAPITVMFGAKLYPGSCDVADSTGAVGPVSCSAWLKLKRNGVVIVELETDLATYFIQDTPSAGNVTYDLCAHIKPPAGAQPQTHAEYYGAATRRIINALETKR